MSDLDRNALRLAYGQVRRGMWASAVEVLWYGDDVAEAIARDASEHVRTCVSDDVHIFPRIFRARLALLLRCLLRADAGDFGKRWQSCFAPGAIPCSKSHRITALWELAPAHGAQR